MPSASLVGVDEIVYLFLFSLMFDIPRYLIATLVLSVMGYRPPMSDKQIKISAVVACHNEEEGLRSCIESLNIDEVIIVDDGSTDGTQEVIYQLIADKLVTKALRLSHRTSKPNAVNVGLEHASHEAVLIIDSDTVILDPSAARRAAQFLLEDDQVGGVSFNLRVRNVWTSLTTRFQAIEYLISITFGKRFSDAFGTLPNVSGAAGIFRKSVLDEVGGLDIEVAEDAALTGKLRAAGWKVRFAPNAVAATAVPETMLALLMQRLRWDSAMVAIWLRKFPHYLNPLRRDFDVGNFLTALDVVLFSIILPTLLPFYIAWLYMLVGNMVWTLLAFTMLGLAACELVILLLTGLPLSLLPYVPYYLVTQLFIMRPARIVFIIGELVGHLTHRDNYIPKYQRGSLS